MTDLRKVTVNPKSLFYYVATVNGKTRLNMPAHVSCRMENVARSMNLTGPQMYNVQMTMKAVRLGGGPADVQLFVEEVKRFPDINSTIAQESGAGQGGSGM